MEFTKTIELNNKGVQHFLNQELEKAKVCYESALSLDPNDATTLNNFGLLLHHQKNYEEAMIYFKRAIEIEAKPNYLINKGNSYAMMGNYSEAKNQYLGAMKIAPEHISGWISLAKLAVHRKAYDEAISYWQQVLKLDDKEAYIIEISRIYILKKEFETALSYLMVSSNRTDNQEIWFLIGQCEFQLRNHGLAEKALKKALAESPDRVDFRQSLALNYLAMGEAKSALQQFDFILNLKPDDFQILTEKGVVLCSLELFDQANRCFEKALVVKPDYAKAIQYKSKAETFLK